MLPVKKACQTPTSEQAPNRTLRSDNDHPLVATAVPIPKEEKHQDEEVRSKPANKIKKCSDDGSASYRVTSNPHHHAFPHENQLLVDLQGPEDDKVNTSTKRSIVHQKMGGQEEVIKLLRMINSASSDNTSKKQRPTLKHLSRDEDVPVPPLRPSPILNKLGKDEGSALHSSYHRYHYSRRNPFSTDGETICKFCSMKTFGHITVKKKARSSPTVSIGKYEGHEQESRQDDLYVTTRSEDNECRYGPPGERVSTRGSCDHDTAAVNRDSFHRIPCRNAATFSLSSPGKNVGPRLSSSMTNASALVKDCHERLYSRSKMKQADGKERRTAIAQKNLDKNWIPCLESFGQISESKAGEMYDRSMAYLREKQLRLHIKKIGSASQIRVTPSRPFLPSSLTTPSTSITNCHERLYNRSRMKRANGKERRKVAEQKYLEKHRIPDFGKICESKAGGISFLHTRQSRLHKTRWSSHEAPLSSSRPVPRTRTPFSSNISDRRSGLCHESPPVSTKNDARFKDRNIPSLLARHIELEKSGRFSFLQPRSIRTSVSNTNYRKRGSNHGSLSSPPVIKSMPVNAENAAQFKDGNISSLARHVELEKRTTCNFPAEAEEMMQESPSHHTTSCKHAPHSEEYCLLDQKVSDELYITPFSFKKTNSLDTLNCTMIHGNNSIDRCTESDQKLRELVAKLKSGFRTVPIVCNYEDEQNSLLASRTLSRHSKCDDGSIEVSQGMLKLKPTDTNDTPTDYSCTSNSCWS